MTEIDGLVFGDKPDTLTREEVVLRLISYSESIEESDRTTKALLRHIMGLYSGEAGARSWRRSLSEGASSGDKPSVIIRRAHQHYIETVKGMAA
jgi:tRNA-dihydrouridine synthase A